MNDEIKNKLTKYLDHIETGVQQGIELAQQEIPLFAQELLNWIFYDNLVNLSVWLVCLIILWLLWKWLVRSCLNEFEKSNDNAFYGLIAVSTAITLAITIAGVIQSVLSIREMVKCTTAPRVVIVEKLHELTRSN